MSDRIKVLVVIGQLEVGGTEMHLLNVLPEVNKTPLEITVYAMRGGGRLHDAFVRAGVRVISPAHHSRRWFGLVRTAWHLLTTWRRERPHVVHFFLPEAYLLGGLCSVVAPPCRRIMSRRSLNDYQRKRPGSRVLERWLHGRMDAVLANSTAVAGQLAAEGVPESRRAVLYNGVRPHDANPGAAAALRESLAIDRDAIVFVMVANLIPYKGHADLIAALALARDALPADWAMLFAGEGSAIRESLVAAATRASIDRRIHWLGRIDHAGQAFDAADIAIHVSHEEGFSNAVLEAMAAGLPVIATAVGGNVDAIVDGETGMLVAPQTPAAIAEALVTLAGDPARRGAFGRAGRDRVLRKFSISERSRGLPASVLRHRGRACCAHRCADRRIGLMAGTPRLRPSVLFAVTEDWYFWSHRKPLAQFLHREGCAVTVATRFNRFEARLREAGFNCIALPFERSLRHPVRDLRAVLLLWRAVRRTQADVVHLVSLKPILLSALAVVCERRTRFVAAFTGMGYLFSSSDRRAHWYRRGVVAVLRVLLRRRTCWIIVQNEDDRALLQSERLGEPARTILIRGVGVDVETFSYREAPPDGPPVVVLPARLIRDKGIEEFVAAARELKQRSIDVRCVLAGADDPDNPAAIARATIDAWIEEGVVEWWGHRDDMPVVYHAAHIVCLPSYREGLPKVLIEAAACGLPLIATNVAGCREVCRDGVNGKLVPPKSAAALVDAIGELVAAPELRHRYGAAGRQLVEAEFSLDQIGRETLACYARILEAAPA